MTAATSLVLILVAGLACQVVAARLRIPAIVVLIATGLTLGPLTGLITIPLPPETVSELVGLGVAVILFEGAMTLRVGELRRVGHGVRRLTLIGPLVAGVLGTAAAYYVGGLSFPTSCVVGAILVVTGPTVIMPMLRQANLKRDTAALFKWEGIVVDPLGVLLATAVFQAFTITQSEPEEVGGLAFALVASTVIGATVGFLAGVTFRRGWVPSHLKSPLLLALVLLVFSVANAVQDEAGLLSVTVMGVVIGNMALADRESLTAFKEGLTVLLLSMLFIIIPATLTREEIGLLDWRIAAFVLVLMFAVRPLTIALVTWRSRIPRNDRIALGWIAPRGIVAAATAGVFGPAMVASGYDDARLLVPTVFLVIVVTVVVHSITLGPLARRLNLTSGDRNGLLIVGGSPWAVALAQRLTSWGVSVTIADSNYDRLQGARMAGVPTYFGEVLSDEGDDDLDRSRLSYALAATDNDYYNALVARTLGREFELHRSFQLTTAGESVNAKRQLSLGNRGSFAFGDDATYTHLEALHRDGWTFHAAHLTPEFGREAFLARLRERTPDALLIGAVDPQGHFRLHSPDQPVRPGVGAHVIYFAPAGTATAPHGERLVAGLDDHA